MGASMRGNDHAMRAGQGNGNAMREAHGNAGNAGNAMRPAHGNGNAMREDRGKGGNARSAERGSQRAVVVDRGHGNDNRVVVVDRRGGDDDHAFRRLGARGLIDGCPPGLAKKHNGCQPPGQVRSPNRLFAFDRPDWWGFSRLGDGRYYYDAGYLMRLGPDGRIGGYIPLLGGALAIGNAWPSYYEPVRLPAYYDDYYNLGPYDSYRYADNVIYRVDPETAAITSIAALLTGDQFAVGQPLPLGYDVYNVPYGYRDQYYDTPDSLYRYSDGYVYQVDPKTQLIAAAIQLLAS
jgi:hypothetical protein